MLIPVILATFSSGFVFGMLAMVFLSNSQS